MSPFASIVVVLLVPAVDSFRVKHARGTAEAQGQPGHVHALYTFGTPEAASPGLKNAHGSPCLPGLRLFNVRQGGLFGQRVDAATKVLRAFGFEHAEMGIVQFNVGSRGDPVTRVDCAASGLSSWVTEPRGVLKFDLHDREHYIRQSAEKMPFLTNISIIGTRKSYMQDRDMVHERVQEYGWRLVDTAYVPATSDGGAGGSQVSHLMQNPDTHECLMTFQGTSDTQDWLSNIGGTVSPKSHFCGLVEPDEKCEGLTSSCTVRNPRGSFVHLGFRNQFRRMVQSEAWQKHIRPNLPFCSTVSVTGHSLGGTLGELFTACAAKAPQPGDYGYEEDYQYISWTKVAPRNLNYK